MKYLQKVAEMKRNKENADDVIARMREVGDEIKALDEELHKVEEELNYIMMRIPNIPHESYQLVIVKMTTLKYVHGEKNRNSDLKRNHIGKLEQI